MLGSTAGHWRRNHSAHFSLPCLAFFSSSVSGPMNPVIFAVQLFQKKKGKTASEVNTYPPGKGKIYFYLFKTEQDCRCRFPASQECVLATKLLQKVAVVAASTSHSSWPPTLASTANRSLLLSDKLILERGYGLWIPFSQPLLSPGCGSMLNPGYMEDFNYTPLFSIS